VPGWTNPCSTINWWAVGELFNAPVLGQVLLAGVLNIVVEGEDGLRRVGHPLGANGLELGHHGAGVVVGHDVERPHRDHVAGPNLVTGRESFCVCLHYFFGDCLRHVDSCLGAAGFKAPFYHRASEECAL
jgi:hypothetical protein